MKLVEAVQAYGVVLELCEKEMNYRDSYAAVTLKRRLQPHAEYYGQKELELVDRYAKKDDEGHVAWTEGGRFLIEDGCEREYFRAKTELDLVDVDEEIEPVVIMDVGTITGAQIEALEGLVVFGEK